MLFATVLVAIVGGTLIGVILYLVRPAYPEVDTTAAEAALAEAHARQAEVDRVVAENQEAVAKLRALLAERAS